MIGTWVAILVMVLVGGRATDRLRTSQLESILTRLPEGDAHAYYERLRRRVRKVALLRAVALVSLLVVFWALRQLLSHPPR